MALGPLMVLHLGAVLALFLITPYTKMTHGAYRMAALVREQQLRAATANATGIGSPGG